MFKLRGQKENLHTYDQPHGFHQPTKGVSWDISAEQSKNMILFKH